VVDCLVFVLVTWGVSALAVQQYKPDQAFNNYLALEMEAMFLLEMVFLAIGLLLGCAMKQYKIAGSVAVYIILVAYFLSIMAGMQTNLDFLKYFTPFKYFDAAQLLKTGRMDGPFLLLSAGIIVICMVAAYWTYNKRDLYI
jgi:ABC-2 type transport system permease protein